MNTIKLNPAIMLVPLVIFILMINIISANHDQHNKHHLRHHNHTLRAEHLSKHAHGIYNHTNHRNHSHPRNRHHIQHTGETKINSSNNSSRQINTKNAPYVAINSHHYGSDSDIDRHDNYDERRVQNNNDQNWRTSSRHNNGINRDVFEMIDDEWSPNAERTTQKIATSTTTTRTVLRKKNPRQNNSPKHNAE